MFFGGFVVRVRIHEGNLWVAGAVADTVANTECTPKIKWYALGGGVRPPLR